MQISRLEPLFQIDHVTIAVRDLTRSIAALGAVHLEPEYGGSHANGVTHMAQLCLDDGGYVELIAARTIGGTSPLWTKHIAEGSGACAWCVRADAVADEVDRLRALSVPVRGPIKGGRKRPDGEQVDWELAFVGEGSSPGATYPFLVRDLTPRSRRVRPSKLTRAAGLTGVEYVVIGVDSIAKWSAEFSRVYDLPPARRLQMQVLGTHVAAIDGQPLLLAEPSGEAGSILSERLRRYGPCPLAVLLGSRDLSLTRHALGIDLPRPRASDIFWLALEGAPNAIGIIQSGAWLAHSPGAD